MNSKLELVTTADGSHSILHTQIGETYHSKYGALQESKHVFIEAGLAFAVQQFPATPIKVLEVGFGTGLNYLNSKFYAQSASISMDYIGIEAFPLSNYWIQQTNYQSFISTEIWNEFLKQYEQNLSTDEMINHFALAKCELLDFQSEETFHVVYFDAFSAANQPEMWEEESIAYACKFLKVGGVFVTYAITGKLKRILKNLGFEIQKLPGAPGKREMLRAIKIV